MALLCLPGCGCRGEEESALREVVVYTALDRTFSEPILAEFQRQTGIKALTVYDTESTKSVGLANRIRAERNRPRCDVYWNNEILNTLMLKKEGLLRPTKPANAELYPDEFKGPDGMWYGFAARARILIVNTDHVPPDQMPASMYDLLDPKWAGQIAIAKPIAGTTATHVACLFQVLGEEKAKEYLAALKDNKVRIESGNKSCAENVGSGALAMAWTDTDDAMIEIEAGRPVKIVYPDAGADGLGTLFIPNTLAAIKDSPHPAEADVLINYLLSPEVGERLAHGPSAQIPLNRESRLALRIKGPRDTRPMQADFETAASHWPAAQEFINVKFLR